MKLVRKIIHFIGLVLLIQEEKQQRTYVLEELWAIWLKVLVAVVGLMYMEQARSEATQSQGIRPPFQPVAARRVTRFGSTTMRAS